MKIASETSRLAGPLYLDASALVKIYVPEAGSEELNATLAGRRDLLVADLALTEIVSSICRRRREGAVSQNVPARLHQALLADVAAGFYLSVDATPAIHREAERLLLLLDRAPLRAGDALHLALAIAAGAATLVTFDARLRDAAFAAGLAVAP